MNVALGGGLGQDAAESEVGGIRFDGEGEFGLEVLQDGSGGEGLLQLSKGSLRFGRPGKFHSLAIEGTERGGQRRVVQDELVIEISET